MPLRQNPSHRIAPRGAAARDPRAIIAAGQREREEVRAAHDALLKRPLIADKLRSVSRVIKVPDVAPLAAAGLNGPPVESTSVNVRFFEDGFIVGASFDVLNEGTQLARSSVGVRIECVGRESAITTDGDGAAFIQMNLLCPWIQTIGVGAFPLVRHVTTGDELRITYNNSATNEGATYNPAGAFYFVADDELPEGCVYPDPLNTELPACTRALLVPNQLDSTGLPTSLAAGVTGEDGVVKVNQDGLILGFRAEPLVNSGTGRAMFSAKLETFAKEEALTCDGTAADFVHVPILCSGWESFLHLVKEACIRDRLRVNFRNTDDSAGVKAAGVWLLRGYSDVAARSLRDR